MVTPCVARELDQQLPEARRAPPDRRPRSARRGSASPARAAPPRRATAAGACRAAGSSAQRVEVARRGRSARRSSAMRACAVAPRAGGTAARAARGSAARSARRRARRTATCSRRAGASPMSPRVDRLAEQQRLARGRRQQAGQHLHRRGLAAAVRAEEAEDLAALDAEADVVDRGEVAEAPGQTVRPRWPAAPSAAAQRRDHRARRWPPRALLRQQGDEGVLERRRAGAGRELGRACRWRARGRRPSRPASRSARPPPCRRWRRARSCPAGARGCGRSAPRTAGATADRRRWSARRGSAGRGRGSARSTGRASASCRRRACRPAGRRTGRGRWRPAARRCAAPRSPPRPGRTGGRRSRRSRRTDEVG